MKQNKKTLHIPTQILLHHSAPLYNKILQEISLNALPLLHLLYSFFNIEV